MEWCCPTQDRYLRPFFVLNTARVSSPQRQPYIQTWVKCPSPPRPPGHYNLVKSHLNVSLLNPLEDQAISFHQLLITRSIPEVSVITNYESSDLPEDQS